MNKILFILAATVAGESALLADEDEVLGGYDPAELEELVALQLPYPHDLSTKVYRDLVSSQIPSTPPELANRGDPDVDADMAYRLYLYYWYCARAPEADQADHSLKDWAERTEEAGDSGLEGIERRAEGMAGMVKLCMPIPPKTDRLLEAFMWLGEAARLDHEVAQISYFETAGSLLSFPGYPDTTLLERHPELFGEFKEATRSSLAKALEKGHPEAYLAMSKALSSQDPVAAYAYAHAARLLVNGKLLASDHREFSKKIGIQKHKLTPSLTSHEITEAEVLAQELAMHLEGRPE